MLGQIIIKNLLFYWPKTITVIILSSLLFFMVFASIGFTLHIQKTADRSLASLHTEIIMQKDQVDKNSSDINTQSIILPFNLQSFSIDSVQNVLQSIEEIKNFSSTLILWQFDLKNNKTLVAINIQDQKVGLRKEIEDCLMTDSKFFTDNAAAQVLLERHFAQLYGYKQGTTYRINQSDFLITGIVDFKNESNLVNAQVFLPFRTALNLIASDQPVVNQVYISLENAAALSRVEKKLSAALPGFSLITKDKLLKNLSAFNKLIYQFGTFLMIAVLILAVILLLLILKMLQLELIGQITILRTLGWPRYAIRSWKIIETGLLLAVALCLSFLLFVIFYNASILTTQIGSLLDQGFKL